MKKLMTQTLFAVAIGGALLSATPANAASFSISFGSPAVGFSYSSGGYCDRWGCPDQFWDYPIYYCPVYYRGSWYSGPVYYRSSRAGYQYWVHGGWRRDTWNRARPRGACVDRYGPPLDLDFYIWNGFNVRDQWRYSWRNNRNDWWSHRQSWDRSNRNDMSWQNWVPTQQRNYDWNRQRDWNSNRDWTRPDWNRADWERRNNIQRGGNVVPSTPTTPFGGVNPAINRNGPITPAPQTTPAFNQPSTSNPPADQGGRNRDRFKGGQGGQGSSGTQGVTATPPVQAAPTVVTPPTNNPPADQGGRNRDRFKGGQGGQGSSGTQGVTATPPVQATPTVTAPANTSPPADEKKDHKKKKDGQDDQGTDQNTPQ